MAVLISRNDSCSTRSRSRLMECLARGREIPTRIARMVIVAISSISVKPAMLFFLMAQLPALLPHLPDAALNGHHARQTQSRGGATGLSWCLAPDSGSGVFRYPKPEQQTEAVPAIRSPYLSCCQCCEPARRSGRLC